MYRNYVAAVIILFSLYPFPGLFIFFLFYFHKILCSLLGEFYAPGEIQDYHIECVFLVYNFFKCRVNC